jgi:acetylornithine deacetylase/succinyl-diaminopimelate desuccinylase-like protein
VKTLKREKIFKHIDQHYDEHLSKLQELVRQPSISAENRGVRECAELVRSYFRDLGCKNPKLVETSGFPVVYGYCMHAKVDVRLVPNMMVEEVIPKIRRHLDKHGFKKVKIVELQDGYGWAKTSVKEPAAQAVIKAYREFGYEPEI